MMFKRRQISKQFSVSELRVDVDAGDDDVPCNPGLVQNVIKRVQLKETRKKLWWKVRTFCDEKGFPQEIGLHEYAERRAKDEEKFNAEFPSIVWREERAARLTKEAADAKRHAKKKAMKESLRLEAKHETELKRLVRMEAIKVKHSQEIDKQSEFYIEKLQREFNHVVRFEKEIRNAREQRERFTTEAAAAEAERVRAKHALAAEREATLQQARVTAAAEKERLLTECVDRLMRCSGTIRGEARDKPPVWSSNELTVRWNDEIDDNDAVLLAFNLLPITTYSKRFPRAVDHARKFPQFFTATIRKVCGQRLGEKGGMAVGRAIAVGAFPRMEELMLSCNDIRFKGCQTLGRSLSTGLCVNLRYLALGTNNLGDSSMKALSEVLQDNGVNKTPRLERIDLNNNDIGNVGAQALAHMLFSKTSPKIKVLKLHNNKIENQGASALTKACKTIDAFELLVLNGNRVTPGAARTIGIHAPYLSL